MSEGKSGWFDALVRTQWFTSWVPDDTTVVDRDDLLVLATPRDASYLNAVYRARLEGADRAARAAHARALVAEVAGLHRGHPSRWQLYEGHTPPELEDALAEAGYRRSNVHYGYSLPVRGSVAPPADGLAVARILDEGALRQAWDVIDRAFGTRTEHSDDELRKDLEAVRAEPPTIVRVLARDAATGAALAHGGLTCFEDTSMGLLWGGGTVPEGRGRGAYRATIWGRVEAAAELGIERVGLFARHDTSAPIVAALGFERSGTLVHWERPAVRGGA